MDRRGLLKLAAAGAATVASVASMAVSAAEQEIQINRRHWVRLGDIQQVLAVYMNDPDGIGWVEVHTIRGDSQTCLTCDNLQPGDVDPRLVLQRLRRAGCNVVDIERPEHSDADGRWARVAE